ncbi:Adenylate and Guanylate cyclase catalytic domain containing protein [Histomonas meleagridis]|uniref:Adenylate and Guanylate cyclase catalytic domain containing protein n=1 Tax=Histomonas meleagridis TaxID=135588 RepID=UPI003559F84B|nr:Adenylate and Guanylate cyclase catalytic domain containing protein [Histomonas meleagridis]KAH0804787.1 Adenylate and Guanylate cyclase catalytic domain containing protein [Histomonas meleagridis]
MDDYEFSLIPVWLNEISENEFIIPAYEVIRESVTSQCATMQTSQIMIPSIILVILGMICGILIIPMFLKTSENAKWSLRLLLFCEPSVVLQSKAIMKILSNDFSDYDNEDNDEKSTFYESVVSHLLDGVLFLTNDLVIRSANHAVGNIIGKSPEKVLGMSLLDLFVSPPDHEASLHAFYQAVDGAMNCLRSPNIVMEVDVMKGSEPVTLQLTFIAISANGEVQMKPINPEGISFIVMSMKDITSTVVSRTLLQEEKARNESLLSMILPQMVVKRLQKGEKNVYFSVLSASIVFIDIVSFTPWCGSHPANYIMSTLNRLFFTLDQILKKYDRMTKIKCIGDCYMCAGGIFDEVNQPSEHATQAISFGLDVIAEIPKLNEELNESLRVRIGINTGGPITAGVLGIQKPTFDILGPAINLAAMMEHNGVPMHVQIPQHVYDLVFDKGFVIKERGEVDVKGTTYHTYVVCGYKN